MPEDLLALPDFVLLEDLAVAALAALEVIGPSIKSKDIEVNTGMDKDCTSFAVILRCLPNSNAVFLSGKTRARMRRWALVGSATAMSAATARIPGIAVFMIMMMIGIDLEMIDMVRVVDGVTVFFNL